MRKLQNRPGEKWAYLPAQGSNEKLCVFIHGFRGDYISTWGRIPEFFAEQADSDLVFHSWDFLFLGYRTSNVESYLDIATLIATQIGLANQKKAPFSNRYTSFALIGHSLGTLGIRQLLCAWSLHPNGLLSSLKSITLFGTPLNGSPWAPVGGLVYKITDALKSGNPQLRMLKAWSDGVFKVKPWPKVNIVLGLDDMVVGHRYAELISWEGDDRVTQTNLDHGDLVKPHSFNNSIVVNTLQNALNF